MGTIQVRSTGRRTRRPTRRVNKPGLASFRSPLTALAVALSLILQLFAVPYHQALSAPVVVSPETAAISAQLEATFGEAAALCVHSDDKGAPHAPGGCCDDQCPFCRFAAQAAALIAPDAPALPRRFDPIRRSIGAARELGAVPFRPNQRNRARAPPPPV
jgi:hypothetical protein